MSDKISPFGVSCKKLRTDNGNISQAEMGEKLGGYTQSQVSAFERVVDAPNDKTKKHKDPPLDYVERCADFFKLKGKERFDLYVAALKSSEKITFELDMIQSLHKEDFAKLLTVLILCEYEISEEKICVGCYAGNYYYADISDYIKHFENNLLIDSVILRIHVL
jgi:hypothetical protein